MQTESRSINRQQSSVSVDKTISGYAGIYYDGTPATEAQLAPGVIERVHPGAFDAAIGSDGECLALYDHDDAMLIGKRSSGSLQLSIDTVGLMYASQYDQSDPVHQTVASRIRRGDCSGSSMTWLLPREGRNYERRSDGVIIRNITRIDAILDVGPTHKPYYTGTSSEMRSVGVDTADRIIAEARGELVDPPTDLDFYIALRGLNQ